MEDITYKGKWYLPGYEEKKIAGTLTFSNEEGAELTLDGSLAYQGSADFLRPDFILGDTYKGKRITLYQCNQFHRGSSISKFSAIFVLEGDHFTDADQLEFNKSASSFFNLNKWLGIHGFSRDPSEPKETSNIKYKKPDAVTFELDGAIGRFDFNVDSSSPSDLAFDAEWIRQRTVFCLNYEQSRPFDKLLKDIRHFQNFLTLAAHAPTYPNYIRLYTNKRKRKIGSVEHPLEIDLYYAPSYFRPVKTQHFFLFSYRDIQNDFLKIISRWYSLNDIIDYPLYLLFGSFYNSANSLENQFLDLARALEMFHRHTTNLEQIRNTKGPPLLNRIESVLNEITNPFLSKIIYEGFAEDVRDTRNYHTHLNPRLEEKSKKEAEELFMITKKIRLVLICAILKETGFDNDKISELLEKNEPRLFYYLIPKKTEETQSPSNEER
ncbi:MAG: hypothetical protein RIG62_00500 [Cyclobacteriaceae bacterium]